MINPRAAASAAADCGLCGAPAAQQTSPALPARPSSVPAASRRRRVLPSEALCPAALCRPPQPTTKTKAALPAPGSPSMATTRRAAAFSPPTTSGEGAGREGDWARPGLGTGAAVPWTAPRPVRGGPGGADRNPHGPLLPWTQTLATPVPASPPAPRGAGLGPVRVGAEAGGGWAGQLRF